MTSRLQSIVLTLFVVAFLTPAEAGERAHPRLMADQSEIDIAREWIKEYPWYRNIFEEHRREIDSFIAHGPIYVSPLKQTYQYQMYTCPVHDV
ncbi:MAG: hypothetical protein WBH55_09210, partial [Bacteroidota bacterium]